MERRQTSLVCFREPEGGQAELQPKLLESILFWQIQKNPKLIVLTFSNLEIKMG